MSKPRIALLHYAAPPIIGGVEATLAAHARLLADNDYPVKIIAGRGLQFDPRVPLQTIPTLDSQHSFVLAVNQKLASGTVPGDFYSLTSAIQHLLESALADVDTCIVHNALTLHKNLALTSALHALAQMGAVRLIGWCHDFAWEDPVYANEVHDGLPWDLLRRPWSGVRYVVVSQARRRQLAALTGLPESEIAVTPPGVDEFEFLGIGMAAGHWMRELSLLDAAPLLLLPARVTRRKNIELAIEITSALHELGFAAKLVVMGPLGPHNPSNRVYLNELLALRRERHVEGQVVFLNEYGSVDDAARRDLYLLADALLFPSALEGFGIPILEAGLARLPIFCSELPPFRESAGPFADYFTLDESPHVIARRIAQFFKHDERYQLKQRVRQNYAWPRIFTEKIEPLLKENPHELQVGASPGHRRGNDL